MLVALRCFVLGCFVLVVAIVAAPSEKQEEQSRGPNRGRHKPAHYKPPANSSLAEFSRLCDAYVSVSDRATFQEATGHRVDELLGHPFWLGSREEEGPRLLLSTGRVVGHPLNSIGMHALRSLLVDRVARQTAAHEWRRRSREVPKTLRRRVEALYDRIAEDGVLVKELGPKARQSFPRLDEEIRWLLIRLSGYSITEGMSYSDFKETEHVDQDQQFYAHVDTYQPTWKIFVFPGGTRQEHGPFTYVKGSHLNDVPKLRWLYNRTQSKLHYDADELTDSVKASAAKLAKKEGPFSDATHGFAPSLRIEGFDYAAPPEQNAEILRDLGFNAPTAVTTLSSETTSSNDHETLTLIIADTSGLHFRGYARPGVVRNGSIIKSAGNGCRGCLPRKNPFFCQRAAPQC